MMGHNVFIIDSLEGAQHTGELVDKITFYTTEKINYSFIQLGWNHSIAPNAEELQIGATFTEA